jgi:hypothetical protein
MAALNTQGVRRSARLPGRIPRRAWGRTGGARRPARGSPVTNVEYLGGDRPAHLPRCPPLLRLLLIAKGCTTKAVQKRLGHQSAMGTLPHTVTCGPTATMRHVPRLISSSASSPRLLRSICALDLRLRRNAALTLIRRSVRSWFFGSSGLGSPDRASCAGGSDLLDRQLNGGYNCQYECHPDADPGTPVGHATG